jgi:tryptophan-rich sensory protein
MQWFKELDRPAMQLPMPAFVTVAGLYYASIGTVLHRSAARGDDRSYRRALVVLAGNELWNVALFGRRSTRAGFFGMLAFAVPVGLLQESVRDDRVSTLVLGPYTAWVVGYDIPWTYRLWRRNP